MRLVLTAEDSKRLGCPESLPISLDTLTNREAVLLQQLGFPTTGALGRRLRVSEDDELDYAAWDALVWLALRRSGVDVDVHTFEYDVANIRLLDDEKAEPLPGPPDDPGKAEAPAASPKKTSTSTRTSRRRSTSTG